MKKPAWRPREGRITVLIRAMAVRCGIVVAALLYAAVVVPNVGIGDDTKSGARVGEVVFLICGVTQTVTVAALVLLTKGWRLRWPWVATGMAVVAMGVLAPFLLPIAREHLLLFAVVVLGGTAVVTGVLSLLAVHATASKRFGLRQSNRGPWSALVAAGQAAWVLVYLMPGMHGMPVGTITPFVIGAQALAWLAAHVLEKVAYSRTPVAASWTGGLLIGAIVSIVSILASIPTDAAIWIALPFLVIADVCVNRFIAVMRGMASWTTVASERDRVPGGAARCAAVGVAIVGVALMSVVTAELGARWSAIAMGAILVATLGVAVVTGLRKLHRVHAKISFGPRAADPSQMRQLCAPGQASYVVLPTDVASAWTPAAESPYDTSSEGTER